MKPPLCLTWLSLAMVLAICVALQTTTGYAQSTPYQTNQVLAPPLYSGYSVAIPNAYLLHFSNWPFLTNSNALPPAPGMERVNGGANWNSLETARGTYSSTMGSLNFAWSGTCSAATGAGGTNNGWIPAADCNNPNASITEGGNTRVAGNLVYTFNTVPGWASSGGTGWPVSAVTVSNCLTTTNKCDVALTINATGFTLNASSGIYDAIIVTNAATLDNGKSLNVGATLASTSGSGASTIINFTVPLTYYSGNTLETRTNYSVSGSNLATVTYGSTYPPSDIYNWAETCAGSDVYLGTTVKGDCYFREFATHLMEQNCNVSTLPSSPLYGQCAIHYFEGWNEFNADGFWKGNYTKLAEMMVDADEIIKQFCGDCYFIAGSVSAGGDGYHQYFPTGADGSAVYSEALGQLLHDWYYQVDATSPRYSTKLYPDAISFHPYPSRTNVPYPPMPETNLSANDTSDAGCYAATGTTGINEPIPYSGTWTEPSHLLCRDSVISALSEISVMVSQLPTSYAFPSGIPVWNTESGIGPNFSSDHGTATAASSSHDPYDATLTAFLDQAYLARQAILTAASGDALNLWYEADNSLWGTLFYLPANQWLKSTSYSVGTFIWDGQTIQQCTSAGTSGTSFPAFSHSGSTTTDGSVIWTNVTSNWVASNNYGGGALVWDGSHLQETNKGGISGISAPSWNATQGGTVIDGTITWENVVANPYLPGGTNSYPISSPMGRTFNQIYKWLKGRDIHFTSIPSSNLKTYAASTHFNVNDMISESGFLQRAVTTGTTGSSAPSWSAGMYNTTTDGSVTLEVVGTPKCYDTSQFSGSLTNGGGTVSTQSVWVCPVSETISGSNYTGQLVWYTPLDTAHTYSVPAGTNCIWDIDGHELSRRYPATITVFNRPALIDNYVDSTCTTP